MGGAENLCSTALHIACQSRRTASSGTTSSKKLDVRPTTAAQASALTATAETARTPKLLPPATRSAAYPSTAKHTHTKASNHHRAPTGMAWVSARCSGTAIVTAA